MSSWNDLSFIYKGFKCIWNHEWERFEIREIGTSYFMGHAKTRESAKKIIDMEVGK